MAIGGGNSHHDRRVDGEICIHTLHISASDSDFIRVLLISDAKPGKENPFMSLSMYLLILVHRLDEFEHSTKALRNSVLDPTEF